MKHGPLEAVAFCGALLSVPIAASAACICRCVNGNVQAICQRAIDAQQSCSPQACPIPPPAVAPIAAPRVPPIGTKTCSNEQVYNPNTNRYEWRNVCH
jgi:hypothetical protein